MTEQIQTQQTENLFKLDVKYLIDICKNLKGIKEEVRILINRNGLRITEIDASNVCMIDVVLNNNYFIALTDNTDIKSYGVNLNNLYKIVKDLKKDNVEVTADNDKLFLKFSSGFKSEISLINIDDENRKIPEIDFNTEIKLSAKRFKEIIKNLNNISDVITLETTKEDLIFLTNGENKTEIKLNRDEVYFKGISKSKYSLEYLKQFIISLISDNVVLKFNNDYPLLTEFITDGFKISYLLAPRTIEED